MTRVSEMTGVEVQQSQLDDMPFEVPRERQHSRIFEILGILVQNPEFVLQCLLGID